MAKNNGVNGFIIGILLLIISAIVFGLVFKKKNQSSLDRDYQVVLEGEEDIKADDNIEIYDLTEYFENIETYHEAIVDNKFLEELDSVVIQGLYNGYEIDNFRFNEFTSRVRNKVYDTFFNTYNFFSMDDMDKLKENAESSEHTWDTFTKELAIVGDHITHLKSGFGEESMIYDTYFSTYIDTGSLNEAVSVFRQELLNRKKYSRREAEIIKRILK